jgi:NhaP-type Na+/H+ or K+/H+ antiporter
VTLAAALTHGFDVAVLVLGLALVAAALAKRRPVPIAAACVLAGFVLGDGGLEVVHFDPSSGFVTQVAIVALVVILFRDGLEIEGEMLQRAWHVPLRKLVLAMPVTAGLVAVATHVLTGLGWTESFLVGALLAPTDPVLTSSVVTNPRVPRLVRHSLNLESGLNDGLALPAVLALLAAVSADSAFDPVTFVLQDVSVGLVTGVAFGFLGGWLLPRSGEPSLYALGVAFAAYGTAVLPPAGNGLIAVFVCAIVLGIRRPEMSGIFEQRADDIVEIVKIGIFLVFGALLTTDLLFADGWATVGVAVFTLVVARPVAVFLALAGTRTDVATRGFMAWFGPKGVATMTFALLVLAEGAPTSERMFGIAALAVVFSVVAHGVTDEPGAEWIARRSASAPG